VGEALDAVEAELARPAPATPDVAEIIEVAEP
jgi:hypothetical protein